jgi:hypothetical protein
MRPAAFVILAVAASACAASAMTQSRTPKAERTLQRELGGKVAGAPVSCLPPFRPGDMTVVDDNTVLFRASHNRVFRNDPPGGCSPMGWGGYALVTRSTSAQMCRGDIVQIVDVGSGQIAGSCALGDFIPYAVPGTKS